MKQIQTLGVPALFLLLGACMTPNGSDRGAQVLGGDDNGTVSDDGGDETDETDETDDGDDETCECTGEADLPYNVNLPLGASFKLTDAFLQKGPLPAAVLELTMEAPEWRFPELLANTTYVVTQADCDHEGNHGTGRDRLNMHSVCSGRTRWQREDRQCDSHLGKKPRDWSASERGPRIAMRARGFT